MNGRHARSGASDGGRRTAPFAAAMASPSRRSSSRPWTRSGRYLQVSRALPRILGREPEDVGDLVSLGRFHPGVLQSHQVEKRDVHAGGSEVWSRSVSLLVTRCAARCTLYVAHDREAALAFLRKGDPRIDLVVLLDWTSHARAAWRCRRADGRRRAPPHARHRAVEAGRRARRSDLRPHADCYARKPMDLDALMDRIGALSAPASGTSAWRRVERPPARFLRLLLVEDNPGDARLVRQLIEEASAEPRVSSTWRRSRRRSCASWWVGSPASCSTSRCRARGLEALTRVRKVAPDAPVVVVTARADQALGVEAVHAGPRPTSSRARSRPRRSAAPSLRHRAQAQRARLLPSPAIP